jgi:8-oxo-dGTP pyrophosphatase MutT (NUDIX family)
LKTIKKVTAFVIREVRENADILLFEHPDAGTQLPAGTVEINEKPEEAVIREVAEETGVTSIVAVKLLGRQLVIMSDGEMTTLRMTKLFNEPSYDSSSSGFALTRGSTVRVQNTVGDFSMVVTDPLIFGEQSDTRVNNIEGYVRTSLLTDRIERYFFHLLSIDDRQEQWDVKADGLIFRCFWTPLRSKIEINKWQQSWLGDYREDLIRSLRFRSTTKPGSE